MDLRNSDMGSKKVVTWDMDISYIRQQTRWILSDKTRDIANFKIRHAAPEPPI